MRPRLWHERVASGDNTSSIQLVCRSRSPIALSARNAGRVRATPADDPARVSLALSWLRESTRFLLAGLALLAGCHPRRQTLPAWSVGR